MISYVSRFINLENQKFFTVPKPFKDEILSSWLIRIAIAHNTQPRTFMNIHFPETNPNFWSKDVDIFWSRQLIFLKSLSYKSNIPIKTIFLMSLQSYAGFLAETIRYTGHNKSLTRIKNRGRSHQLFGVRFCPQCLQSDDTPYFRKIWRLSFVTTCKKHKCFLHDRCPKCKHPITPYIMREKEDLLKCHLCGFSFERCKSPTIILDSYGLIAQKNLLSILNKGYFTFQNETYISLTYFPAFHQLTKLLYNSSLHKSAFNHEKLYRQHTLSIFEKKSSLYIEDAPIQEQYLIYSAAEYLLQSPKRMKRFCQKNHLGKGMLTHSMNYIPFWFSHIVIENDISFYSVHIEEVKSLILFLQKKHIPISFKTLSKYLGSTIASKKRPDIKNLLSKKYT